MILKLIVDDGKLGVIGWGVLRKGRFMCVG